MPQVPNYADQGGALWHIGGSLKLEAAGGLKVGTLGPFRMVYGQATTVTALDTIVSGLTTVVAVVACLNDDLSADPAWVSAAVGDQAGAPAAGSFYLKTWKPTSAANPTPIAATTFGKKVNWIAFGT